MRDPAINKGIFALRLGRVVEKHGSVRAVAQAAGLPKPTVEGWLYGYSLPNTIALARLCAGCNVSADWLLFGEERP